MTWGGEYCADGASGLLILSWHRLPRNVLFTIPPLTRDETSFMSPKMAIAIKQFCHSVRHSSALKVLDPLFERLKPVYTKSMELLFFRGCEITINDRDTMRVTFPFASMSGSYEPDIYNHFMSNVRPHDAIVEVGGFIGVYTIPMAKRLGDRGSVTVFEPEPHNAVCLRKHIGMNDVAEKVTLVQLAVGKEEGHVYFTTGGFASSFAEETPSQDTNKIPMTRLDSILKDQKIDILKIDVEGFEEDVLRGAANLLADRKRCPRVIYVEVHPQFWDRSGATSRSFLGTLKESDYEVHDMQGNLVTEVVEYGEVIASKMDASTANNET